MNRRLLRILCLLSSASILFTGCAKQAETPQEHSAQQEHSIISGIALGMTSEEVFSVAGKAYDYSFTEDTYKHTVEYDYSIVEDDAFHTGLSGYLFLEFDAETDTLLTYGYHLGHTGDYESPVYPYPEEELTKQYQAVKEILTEWYGEGTASSENVDYGAKEEYIWQEDDQQIWAMYGVNLWGLNEPEQYENGVNEIIISCTSNF